MNKQPAMSIVYQAPKGTGEFAGKINIIHAEEIVSIAFVEKTKKELCLRITTKSDIIDITDAAAIYDIRTMFNNYCILIGAAMHMQPEEQSNVTEHKRPGEKDPGGITGAAGQSEQVDGSGQS